MTRVHFQSNREYKSRMNEKWNDKNDFIGFLLYANVSEKSV